jgi:hypothetical protein
VVGSAPFLAARVWTSNLPPCMASPVAEYSCGVTV